MHVALQKDMILCVILMEEAVFTKHCHMLTLTMEARWIAAKLTSNVSSKYDCTQKPMTYLTPVTSLSS